MLIEFDEETHSYHLTRDGERRRVESLTRLLSPLNDFSRINPDVLAAAAERGKRVHAATVLMEGGGDGSGLHWPSVPEEEVGYLKAYEKFLDWSNWRSLKMEFPVGSWKYRFACTPDRLGEHEGRLAVAEIKTTLPYASYGPQTAGQQLCIEEWLGLKVERRMTIYLKRDGSFSPRRDVIVYRSLNDRACLLNCIAHYWQTQHHSKEV